MNSNLNWVFFDLDDTLWNFSQNSLDTLLELYKNNVYLHKYFLSFDNFSDQYHLINDRMWHLYQLGEINSDQVKRLRFEKLLAPFISGDRLYEEADRLQRDYLWQLGEKKLLIEGAEAALRLLSKYFLIGILSNGFREVQYRKLYGTPVWRYVQRMVLSDEIGISKPNAELFRYAERATGAKRERCVMIGDNPEADICGALNAGWQAILFDRKGNGRTIEGVPVVSRLSECTELLLTDTI